MAKRITKHIPNTITCLNLFSGCISCVFAFQGMFTYALFFIVLGAVFDFFDGLAARALNAHSIIGKDIDSLADLITFGFAPAVMLYTLLEVEFIDGGWSYLLPFLAFLITVFSTLRLAKFNNDSRQVSSFIGLPVPANALFWGATIAGGDEWLFELPIWAILVVVLLSCWLLVSELPMFSLKFKNLSWGDNKIRFVFLAVCVALLFLGIPGIALIILWYIALSIAVWVYNSYNSKKEC